MPDDVLTEEQIGAMGKTIGAMLRADMSKHISELLPDVLKAHGVDVAALKESQVGAKRLPLAEGTAGSGGSNWPWGVPKGGASHTVSPESAALAALLGGSSKGSLYRQALEMNGKFAAFGEFLSAIHPFIMQRTGLDPRLKVLGEGQGDAGGFLVPVEFTNALMALALESAIVRPRAFVMPMASNDVRIPTIRDTTHATNVFGGVQAYWTAESATLTASEPTFSQMQLIAQKLAGYTSVTNELLQDAAIGLEALITRLFGQAIGFFEDDAFINGDGAGKPVGILNADALVSQAKETGQAANTVVAENLDGMYARMLPGSLNRAIWLAHPNVFPQLAAMSRNVGTGGSAVWVSNIAGAPPATIYSRPVIFTEFCQTVGTLGDIYFVDLSYYVIGDRQALSMAASPHVRFPQDETVYRFVERLAGRPWLETPLTLRYGSYNVSPFVALAARA